MVLLHRGCLTVPAAADRKLAAAVGILSRYLADDLAQRPRLGRVVRVIFNLSPCLRDGRRA
jgi:hypothetical protein